MLVLLCVECKVRVVCVCLRIDFDPNIPYASLKKGKKLGAGAFATVYEV